MKTKIHIRKAALEKRDCLSEAERLQKSRIITETIMSLEEYRKAEIILIYVNFRSEVETMELIELSLAQEKKIYCPRTTPEQMEFYQIVSLEDLQTGLWGILEPPFSVETKCSHEMIQEKECLMIMPGSAFDRERNRVGYGKGYYDRYLMQSGHCRTAAICFECQMTDRIPSANYDIKPDQIITEVGIYS